MGIILQNERQYEFTKTQLAGLESALKSAQESPSDSPEIARRANESGIKILMGDLREQLAEYEKLRGGQVKSLALDEVLVQLPATLVRARIARGWTQRELAKQLGTSEQQVQKDEAGAYARANLEKLSRIAGVLGVSLSGRAKLTRSGIAPKTRDAKRATPTKTKRAISSR